MAPARKHHMTPTAENSTAHSKPSHDLEKPFPFFRLPTELRHLVYGFVVPKVYIRAKWYRDPVSMLPRCLLKGEQWLRSNPTNILRLIRSCREVRDKLLPRLYRYVEFECGLSLRTFLDRIGGNSLYITSIHLRRVSETRHLNASLLRPLSRGALRYFTVGAADGSGVWPSHLRQWPAAKLHLCKLLANWVFYYAVGKPGLREERFDGIKLELRKLCPQQGRMVDDTEGIEEVLKLIRKKAKLPEKTIPEAQGSSKAT